MAKFSGMLGVVCGYENVNSVAVPKIEKYKVCGDMYQMSIKHDSGDRINDNLNISNRFSFIAPKRLVTLLSTNSQAITAMYVEYRGLKLKVTDMTFAEPRINLSTGGIYIE